MSITLKVQRLIDANQRSPLVYQSASSELDAITFRLHDGGVFELTADEARAIGAAGHVLRWAHLVGVGAAPVGLLGCPA